MLKIINPTKVLENNYSKQLTNDNRIDEYETLLATLLNSYPNENEFLAQPKTYSIIYQKKEIKISLTVPLFKMLSNNKTAHYHTYTLLPEQGAMAATLKTRSCKVKKNNAGEPTLHAIGTKRKKPFKIIKAVTNEPSNQTISLEKTEQLNNEAEVFKQVRPGKKSNLQKACYTLFSSQSKSRATTLFAQDYIEGIDGITLVSDRQYPKYMDTNKLFKNKSLANFLKLFLKLLKDLQQFHSRDLIHSDIKPENIIFKPNGSAKLIDFGGTKKTGSKNCLSTIGWIPVDALENQCTTKASDIAMLGFSLLYVYDIESMTQTEYQAKIILNGKQHLLPYPHLMPEMLDKLLQKKFSLERKNMHSLLKAMVDKAPEKRPDVNTCITQIEMMIAALQTSKNRNINKSGLFPPPTDKESYSTLNLDPAPKTKVKSFLI